MVLKSILYTFISREMFVGIHRNSFRKLFHIELLYPKMIRRETISVVSFLAARTIFECTLDSSDKQFRQLDERRSHGAIKKNPRDTAWFHFSANRRIAEVTAWMNVNYVRLVVCRLMRRLNLSKMIYRDSRCMSSYVEAFMHLRLRRKQARIINIFSNVFPLLKLQPWLIALFNQLWLIYVLKKIQARQKYKYHANTKKYDHLFILKFIALKSMCSLICDRSRIY